MRPSGTVDAALWQAVWFDGDFAYMPDFVVPGVLLVVLGVVLLAVGVLQSGVLPRSTAAALLMGGARDAGVQRTDDRGPARTPHGGGMDRRRLHLWSPSDAGGAPGRVGRAASAYRSRPPMAS
jgi:hypothetical protein